MAYYASVLALILSVAFLLGVVVLWLVTPMDARKQRRKERDWARKLGDEDNQL